jgi:pilus assembly protein Flp/PilA
MTSFMQRTSRLVRDEAGQDMIEYALVAALLGLGAIATLRGLATNITHALTSIGTTLTNDV